ncbi:hypothetical protein [Ponticoccus sp. (in: a-proteobacteria)]|uniref:hypothetical protein n=1 Tax=Ponticoccus sp. (in: a-proteobacteria) TaxID=1925025 RepID=UPI003AB7E818
MQREIAHPDIRTPITEWWNGHYDHVFIALYPFFRVRSEIRDSLLNVSYDAVLRYEDRPDDFDERVKRFGEPVTWNSIHYSVAPSVPKMSFYRAVWLLSCLGFTKRADTTLQKQIEAYCDANNIYLPEDDCLPAILHPLLNGFLQPYNGEKILMYDEFRQYSSELDLDSLGPNAPVSKLPEGATGDGVWAIHLPESGVLVTSAFDGAEALVAMTKDAYALSDPHKFFEVEEVGDDTYCDWLNPKDFFERRV